MQSIQADEGAHQKMTYSVFASGINAVEANLDIDTSKKGKYSMFMKARTRGFLGRIVPWSGTFESNGWVKTGKDAQKSFHPSVHKSTAMWRGKNKIKEYKYKKDGTFGGLFITEGDTPTIKKEVKKELTNGTTDVLSATLVALEQISQGQGCASNAEVFDGKRRFKMIFKRNKDKELTSSRYNTYNGIAIECVVEVVPVAGAWHKKPRGWLSIQEQGRERGTMPTVWFGKVAENLPAIPVKVLVKTGHGALVMHLVKYDNGTVQLALKE